MSRALPSAALTCTLATALAALVSISATAAPPRSDVGLKQAQIREVLADLGLAPEGDQLSFGPRGRRDLVVFSPRARDAIVSTLKEAHRTERSLLHGYWVAGYAHILTTGTYVFTLKDPAEGSWVIELADAGVGSRIVVWGVGRELLPERRPRADLPMRLLDPR